MQKKIFGLLLLLFSMCLWAQHPSASKSESATIQRVKAVLVSSLDRRLPRVTLEFFLEYEGSGAAIRWKVSDCSERNSTADIRSHDADKCVEAEINLKDDRTVTVLVAIGESSSGAVRPPAVVSVTIIDQAGLVHIVQHLGDLPVHLRRRLPKNPKDSTFPVLAELGVQQFSFATTKH